MLVTKLIPSKHVPGRWYAELENGETIKVNVDLIADFSLYTGCDLDDEELSALKASAGKMSAKSRALKLIGTRQMSKKEISDKLRQKGETSENVEEAVDFLERIGAVNDEEYAAAIVRHYSARGYGTGKIKSELMRRGVPKEYWEEALEEQPDMSEAIDSLIARKLRGKTPDRKELKKLTDMLLRRGFSWSEIREALERGRIMEEEY